MFINKLVEIWRIGRLLGERYSWDSNLNKWRNGHGKARMPYKESKCRLLNLGKKNPALQRAAECRLFWQQTLLVFVLGHQLNRSQQTCPVVKKQTPRWGVNRQAGSKARVAIASVCAARCGLSSDTCFGGLELCPGRDPVCCCKSQSVLLDGQRAALLAYRLMTWVVNDSLWYRKAISSCLHARKAETAVRADQVNNLASLFGVMSGAALKLDSRPMETWRVCQCALMVLYLTTPSCLVGLAVFQECEILMFR